jgi:hypothetical protein
MRGAIMTDPRTLLPASERARLKALATDYTFEPFDAPRGLGGDLEYLEDLVKRYGAWTRLDVAVARETIRLKGEQG